ncbi:MAG: hypothetical protein WC807_04725 [Hyphomicrobium sp.]|jgi:hypothetical protein
MSESDAKSVSEAIATARTLIAADEQVRVEVLHRLRQTHRLSETVRGLNGLLANPEYRPLGEQALRKVGLGYAG